MCRHKWNEPKIIKIGDDELKEKVCKKCNQAQIWMKGPSSSIGFYITIASAFIGIFGGLGFLVIHQFIIGITLELVGISSIAVLPFVAKTSCDYYLAEYDWYPKEDYEEIKRAMDLSHMAGYYGI